VAKDEHFDGLWLVQFIDTVVEVAEKTIARDRAILSGDEWQGRGKL
jgi:hypothetical protein